MCQARDQPQPRETRGGGDDDGLGAPLAVQLGADLVQPRQHLADRTLQRVAVFGESQCAVQAAEQRQAVVVFQRRDLAADRRLRQREFIGGLRE